MFAPLKYFTLTIWLIVTATFAGRFVQFMIWPFLAILLYQQFGLNEFEVGLFLASATAIGIIFGFYVGYLSDNIGRRKVILAGIALSIIGMGILGFSSEIWHFYLGTLIQSLARPMVEGPGRALMTDTVADRKVKDMALHVRYFALNVGAATGPIIGATIGLAGRQSTFLLLATVYLIYLIAAGIVFRIERPPQSSSMGKAFRFITVLNVLHKDTGFLLFVLATLLCFTAYGQIEAGLVQYLRQEGIADLVTLYAILIGINATTIVVFQFPLLKITESLQPSRRAMIGVLLLSVGFTGFAIAPLDPAYPVYFAMFVLSVGEAILFPTTSIIVDRLAPPDLKGSYFGAESLTAFGFALAPLVGGALLHWLGGFTLWMAMAGLSVIVAYLYRLAARLSRVSV